MLDKVLEPVEVLPRDVEAFPRVTKVIGSTLAAPELVEYAYYQTVDLIAGLVSHMVSTQLLPVDDVLDVLTDGDWLREALALNRMTPRDALSEAADLGVEGHDFLERLAKMQLFDGERDMEEAERMLDAGNHRAAIAHWWLASRPIVLATERQVYSLRHGFRGTLDLYWKRFDGARVITDLKNRKANKPCGVAHKSQEAAERCHYVGAYRSDHVQTGAYKIALEEQGSVVDTRTVLVARADGTWGEYTSDDIVPETFLSLLDVYNKTQGR